MLVYERCSFSEIKFKVGMLHDTGIRYVRSRLQLLPAKQKKMHQALHTSTSTQLKKGQEQNLSFLSDPIHNWINFRFKATKGVGLIA